MKKRILVIDDKQENLDMAISQLSDEYEVIVAYTPNEARCLLTGQFDEGRAFNLYEKRRKEAGIKERYDVLTERIEDLKKEIRVVKEKLANNYKDYYGKWNEIEEWEEIYRKKINHLEKQLQEWKSSIKWTDEKKAIRNEATEEIKNLPKLKFDIVATDCFMPGEAYGQGSRGEKLVGEEMPAGLVLAILAIQKEVPQVIIVSGGGNHHDNPLVWLMDAIQGSGRISCGCETTQDGQKDWKKTIEKFSS